MILDDLEFLQRALLSPCGIVLEVQDFESARQRLYAVRRKACEPDFDLLQFRKGTDGNLWIVKGHQQ